MALVAITPKIGCGCQNPPPVVRIMVYCGPIAQVREQAKWWPAHQGQRLMAVQVPPLRVAIQGNRRALMGDHSGIRLSGAGTDQ